MKRGVRTGCLLAIVVCCPFLAHAQESWADKVASLQSVLDTLYEEMLPLCSRLIGAGRAIAGFAALWVIASKVWGHIARAEPVDVYPLFRPFVIGFAVLVFPSVIALTNGILNIPLSATNAIKTDSDKAIAVLLKKKEAAIKSSKFYEMYIGGNGEGNSDQWYAYTHPKDPNRQDEDWIDAIGNEVKFAMSKASYNFRNAIKEVISEILQLLFAAVALCINTLRTFNLIILAILGPLVFGLSTFDGFQHSLKQWLARYVNVFMWLPVANLFGAIIGKIQENMLKIDLSQIGQEGDTFFSRTDAGYLIFLIIGIIGYTTVPSVANYIMMAGGSALNSKVSGAAGAAIGGASAMAGAATMATASQVGAGAVNMTSAPGDLHQGYQSGSTGSGLAASAGRAAGHLQQRLSGNNKIT